MKALAAEHGIEAVNAGRDAFLRRFMREPQGCDRQHREAGPIDQERVFIRTVD
jgi:hypothetical protein